MATAKPLLPSNSLIWGGLTALLGFASSWSSSHLFHDDFDLFLMMYLGGSCLIWPLACLAIVTGLVEFSRGDGWLQPLISLCLGCIGIVLVLISWDG